jgi:dihydrofolate synthase / folylpolyglutamate synthase
MLHRTSQDQAFRSSIDWLVQLKPHGIQLGLDRVEEVLSRLGNPQKSYRVVTVAGTNGKGSTAKFLGSILSTAGYRTGIYTSPHLVDIRERICLGSMMIGPEDLVKWVHRLQEVMSHPTDIHLTFFEALTVIALGYFSERDVEVAVLEVGLGGRLDATAAAKADVAVITGIGLDHQDFLGDTLEAICGEKAGIITEGSTVVTNVQDNLFRSVIGPIAFEKRCPIRRLGVDFLYEWIEDLGFRYRGWINRLGPVILGLEGSHQGDNASLACAAAESLASMGFHFRPVDVAEGLLRARHPGRLERREAFTCDKGRMWPTFLLDGAHNPAAASVLVDHLDEHLPERPRVMLFGAKKGKNHLEMLSELGPHVDCVILTTASEGREFTPDCIREARNLLPEVLFEPDLVRAIELATDMAHPRGGVLLTGSLYLVGDVMGYLPKAHPI